MLFYYIKSSELSKASLIIIVASEIVKLKEKYVLVLTLTFTYPLKIGGWMTCDFTSFSTVFQSYLADERFIMKGCVQLNPVYG